MMDRAEGPYVLGQNGRQPAGAVTGTGQNVAADPWIHRSDGMRCKTCIWFVPKAVSEARKQELGFSGMGGPLYDLGRCRRHAPTMGGYPVVFVNDWCGDHRLDENKYQG